MAEETKLQNIFIDEKRRPCVVSCGERSLCACARKWTSTKRPLAAETLMISNSLFFIGASNRQARILYAVNQKCSRKFTDRVYEIYIEAKQNLLAKATLECYFRLGRWRPVVSSFFSFLLFHAEELNSWVFCAWVDHWTVKIIRVSAQRFHWSVFILFFVTQLRLAHKVSGDLRRISCAMCEPL